MKILFSFLTFLLFTIGTICATDYYVDSNAGDDSRTGTAPTEAWRSIARVNAFPFQPGDHILFKRGGFWRESLHLGKGAEGKPLVYATYGEGSAKPTLAQGVALNDERDWVDDGDGIWATRPTIVTQVENGMVDFSGAWEILTDDAIEAKTESLDGEAPQIRVTAEKSGENRRALRAVSAPFAVEKGKFYRLSYSASATIPSVPNQTFLIDGTPHDSDFEKNFGEFQVTNIAIHPEEQEKFLVFKATETLSSARVVLYFGKTFPKKSSMTLGRGFVTEVEVDQAPVGVSDIGNIVLDGNHAAFRKLTRDELENEDDYYFDSTKEDRVFYKSKENPAKRFKSIEACVMRDVVSHAGAEWVVVDGLAVTLGAAHGFGGASAKHIIIRNCDISWIGGGDQYATGAAGRRTRYGNGVEFWSNASDCLVEKNRIWEIYDAALTNQGDGANVEENITYRDNLIWNSEYSFEFWNGGPESMTRNIFFENNACFDAGYGWGHEQRPNKNGRHLMFYHHASKTENIRIVNNIFCNAIDSITRLKPSGWEWTEKELTLDGNLYYNGDDRLLIIWRGEEFWTKDFDTWRKKFHVEENGRIGLPEKSLQDRLKETAP